MVTGSLKGDFVKGAFDEARISGLTKIPSGADNELGLTMLENLASEWGSPGRNICVGYNFEDEPDAASVHNVERAYWEAFRTNLAVRLLSAFGKGMQPDPLLMSRRRASFSFISAATAMVRPVQYPSRMPRGSGATQRTTRWQRFNRPVEQAPISCKTQKMFIGEIDDFTEHFDTVLSDIEDISTYTMEATPGLSILSQSLSTPDVSYRIEAVGFGDENRPSSFLQVKIIATTSTGRVITRLINFELTEAR